MPLFSDQWLISKILDISKLSSTEVSNMLHLLQTNLVRKIIYRTIAESTCCSKKNKLNQNQLKRPFFEFLKGLFYTQMRITPH
jgi:hypothetical protein